jgi:hypothetical protein
MQSLPARRVETSKRTFPIGQVDQPAPSRSPSSHQCAKCGRGFLPADRSLARLPINGLRTGLLLTGSALSASSTRMRLKRPFLMLSCRSVSAANHPSAPSSSRTAAAAMPTSPIVIAGDWSMKRPSHRAAARGQRSSSSSAVSSVSASASARPTVPSSRAASVARRRCRSRIARWKRPRAVPWLVIGLTAGATARQYRNGRLIRRLQRLIEYAAKTPPVASLVTFPAEWSFVQLSETRRYRDQKEYGGGWPIFGSCARRALDSASVARLRLYAERQPIATEGTSWT